MRQAPFPIALLILMLGPFAQAADNKGTSEKVDKPVEVKDLAQANALPRDTRSVAVEYIYGLRKGGQFKAMLKSLAVHPRIRHLSIKLRNSTHVEDDVLDVLAEFESLESLDLRDSRDWEPGAFMQQVMAMQNLKHATFEFFCRSPSVEKWETALKAMPRLESVIFSDGRDHTKRDWETALNKLARDTIARRSAGKDEAVPAPRRQPIVPGIRATPFVIGNRDEPTDTQLNAFAKIFCVALRKLNSDDSKAHALRVFIDPRYLAKHGLSEGELPVKTIVVGSVFNMTIAQDRRTVVCEVSTREHEKELILLRLTLHEGALYLSPGTPPDEQGGTFSPWILRMKLSAGSASDVNRQ